MIYKSLIPQLQVSFLIHNHIFIILHIISFVLIFPFSLFLQLEPGSEFRSAVKAANEVDARVVLGDRDQRV